MFIDNTVNKVSNVTTQQALRDVINRATQTIANTPAENWTLGLADSRLELLREYWNDFQHNHLELLHVEENVRNAYIKENVYGEVEEKVVTARAKLYDIQAQLSQPMLKTADQPQLHGKARLPRITIPVFTGLGVFSRFVLSLDP